MKGSKIFENEIGRIQDSHLRHLVMKYMDDVVPEYFYEVAASSSGKYHPWYSLGFGGLVRHTKAAVAIGADLLTLEQNKDLPADCIIAALIIHDTFKHGMFDTGYTIFSHPIESAKQFAQFARKYNKECSVPVDDAVINLIVLLVESHMGQWNTNRNSVNVVLPKPLTIEQQFVHTCDYIASRRYITVEVE